MVCCIQVVSGGLWYVKSRFLGPEICRVARRVYQVALLDHILDAFLDLIVVEGEWVKRVQRRLLL
jgi:hypothetical protein